LDIRFISRVAPQNPKTPYIGLVNQ
jgi:hypothetical protein